MPDPHDGDVLRLLYVLCHWHGLAKLRLHTDETLDIFDRVTKDLGSHIRSFASDTCPSFVTKELSREAEARRRRQGQQNLGKSSGPQGATSHRHGQQPKGLNLQTYKLHALADYPSQIRLYGTTDWYSTQIVCFVFVHVIRNLFSTTQGELEHRTSKVQFARTSHKAYISQLASIERRQARIRRICMNRDALNLADPIPSKPEEHHTIGQSQNFPENLTRFMQANTGDPAVKVSLHSSYDLVAGLIAMTYCKHFILKLRAHILPRIAVVHQKLNPQTTLDSAILDFLHVSNETMLQSPPLQLNHVIFKGERIYRHRLLHVNYTTYDLRREFDSINPRTDHRDIMLLSSSDDGHPFCYAWVLGIFHANIIYTGPGSNDFQSQRIEFLWVRWFEVIQDHPLLWEQQTLDTVKFLPMADKDAFGFVDPANIVRGCHVIPAFADGQLHPNGTAPSRWAGDSDAWKLYYINR